MRNVLLVQASFTWTLDKKAMYLPYALGCVWAECLTSDTVKEHYTLVDMQVERTNIDDVVNQYESLDVIGLSCYCWNYNYTNALAKKIKEKFPNCLIIFGGPEVEHKDKNIFKNKPYVDIVIKNEGEISFKKILEHRHSNKSYNSIPGLVINNNLEAIDSGTPERIDNLESLPSPYTTGLFDMLIQKSTDTQWDAMIDTNRGCPYQCTYCDWGSLTYSKIRKRNLELVKEEFEWMAQNKIEMLFINDANFGILYERDLAIAKHLSDTRIKYGYPKFVSPNWPKKGRKQILNIAKELFRPNEPNSIRSGLTISVQSFSYDALKAVKRDNFDINETEQFVKECETAGIFTYDIDMILGLPEETLQSWKDGFFHMFNAGLHHNFLIQPTAVLENTELNQVQRDKNKIKTIKQRISGNAKYDKSPNIPEYLEIICQTNSMPLQDMIDAVMFTNVMTTIHGNGLISELVKFVCKYKSISFKEFYKNISDILLKDTKFSSLYSECKDVIKKMFTGEGSEFKYGLDQRAQFHYLNALCMAEDAQTNIKNIMYNYTRELFNDDVELWKSLCNYNDHCYFDYSSKHQTEITKEYNYNFLEFIKGKEEFGKFDTLYKFTNPIPNDDITKVEFAVKSSQRQRNMPNMARIDATII